MHSSRNIKAWQHSAGTSKQLPKSKTQIAFAQLASTPIHLHTNKQGAACTSIKEHKKSKQRLYTQHHQRGGKHQILTHKETMPQFRSCQTLLGKLEQKQEMSILWFFMTLCQHNDFLKQQWTTRQWNKVITHSDSKTEWPRQTQKGRTGHHVTNFKV